MRSLAILFDNLEISSCSDGKKMKMRGVRDVLGRNYARLRLKYMAVRDWPNIMHELSTTDKTAYDADT